MRCLHPLQKMSIMINSRSIKKTIKDNLIKIDSNNRKKLLTIINRRGVVELIIILLTLLKEVTRWISKIMIRLVKIDKVLIRLKLKRF